MSRPKRSRHRVPVDQLMKSATLTDEYAAEVNAATDALTRRWEKAQKRVAAAEARREKVAARLAVEANRGAERRERERLAEQAELDRLTERVEAARLIHDASLEHLEAERHRAETRARLSREERHREARIVAERQHDALAALQAEIDRAESEVLDIARLMMPGNYAGREHRGTKARAKHRS